MTATRNTRNTRSKQSQGDKMEHKAVLESLRRELYVEHREACEKAKAASRELRCRRERIVEIIAKIQHLDRVEACLDAAEAEEAEISPEIRARLSAMILACLEQSSEGVTLDQLSRMIPESKKSTLSSTLYNLKKRREVMHIEATGRYRLAQRVAVPGKGVAFTSPGPGTATR